MVHRFSRGYRIGHRGVGCLFSRARRRPNPAAGRHSQLLSFFFLALLAALPAHAVNFADYGPLKHPIVFVHGATTKGSKLQIGIFNFGDYFHKIPGLYRLTRTPVKVAELSTDSSIGERAAVLKNFLETEMREQTVNLVAHSLGGLDARYMISILKTNQVVSLTTIGTPHRGTPLADWAMNQIQSRGFWYMLLRIFGYDMATRRFLPEMSVGAMKYFNEKVVDSPDVQYFSVRTSAGFNFSKMSLFLWFPAYWLEQQNGGPIPGGHDGMVPLESQGWGTVLSSSELDHLGQINHHRARLESQVEPAMAVYSQIYGNLLTRGL